MRPTLLTDPEANLSAGFGMAVTSPPADRLVDDGERLEIAGLAFQVREIPGHSPGSVVFVADGFEPPFVIGGDVLFAGSVGRFDFPGGDEHRLFSGIRTKLFDLPDGTAGLARSRITHDRRSGTPHKSLCRRRWGLASARLIWFDKGVTTRLTSPRRR